MIGEKMESSNPINLTYNKFNIKCQFKLFNISTKI